LHSGDGHGHPAPATHLACNLPGVPRGVAVLYLPATTRVLRSPCLPCHTAPRSDKHALLQWPATNCASACAVVASMPGQQGFVHPTHPHLAARHASTLPRRVSPLDVPRHEQRQGHNEGQTKRRVLERLTVVAHTHNSDHAHHATHCPAMSPCPEGMQHATHSHSLPCVVNRMPGVVSLGY